MQRRLPASAHHNLQLPNFKLRVLHVFSPGRNLHIFPEFPGVWILANVGRLGEDGVAQLGKQRLILEKGKKCRDFCTPVGRLGEPM